jgi:tryptophan-rich sensory protein
MNYKKLISAIILCQLAGIIGVVFTNPAIPTWYASLIKPSFNPPNWVFGPVWTFLYTLMGISLYRITEIDIKGPLIRKGIFLFVIQLILNSIWSILFFGLQNPLLAFGEIIILWLLIVATIYQFNKIDKSASYLLVPYLLWVSFAAILNYSIWRLNS